MKSRKNRNIWTSNFETLELRALLSGDGILPVVPPGLPPDLNADEGDPAVSGPIEPIGPIAEPAPPFAVEIDVDSELGNDIHSGSLDASATLLTLEGGHARVASNIDRDADGDAFRFVATEQTTNVDAFGELPLIVRLHDSEGNVVGEQEASGPEDVDEGGIEHHYAFAHAETVPGDTYYVTVGSTKGRVGSYELLLNAFAPPPPPTPDSPLGEDAHGDSFEVATDLELEHGFAQVTSNIDSEGDIDVFGISINGGLLFAEVHGFEGQQLTVELLAADGRIIPDVDAEEGFVGIGREIEEGDYFVRVTGDVGLYEMFIHAESGIVIVDPIVSTDEVDAPMGEDIHGDTVSDATKFFHAVEPLASVVSNIDSSTDHDVFSIEANERGDEIPFDVVSLSDTMTLEVEILGADGEALMDGGEVIGFGPDGEPVGGSGFLIEGFFDPEPNQVFFLSIGSAGDGTGPYKLNVLGTPTPPPLPIDPLPIEPLPIDPPVLPIEPVLDSTLGNDVHGEDINSPSKLFPVGGGSYAVLTNIDSIEDRDVFALPSNSRGDEVLFDVYSTVEEEIEFDVQVLGPDGESIPFEAALDTNLVEGFFDPEAEGTHYISIGASAPIPYRLGVFLAGEQIIIEPPPVVILPPVEPFLEPDAELGDDIHGPDLENATELSLNERGFYQISSNIDEAGDVDVFRIAGTGDLFVAELGGFGATEMLFKVFTEDGELIAQANAGEPFEFETVADDTYFITAESTGDDPGQYFAFVQPIVVPDLPPVSPPFVDPEEPIEPGLPIEPALPPDTSEPEVIDPVDQNGGTDGEGDGVNLDEKRTLTADLDGNGLVDFSDFLKISFNFGNEVDAVFADGDVNGDGAIDFDDFVILSGEFGNFVS